MNTIETPKPAGTVMLHAQLALLLNILESGFVEMVVPDVPTVCVPEQGAPRDDSDVNIKMKIYRRVAIVSTPARRSTATHTVDSITRFEMIFDREEFFNGVGFSIPLLGERGL